MVDQVHLTNVELGRKERLTDNGHTDIAVTRHVTLKNHRSADQRSQLSHVFGL